MLHTPTHAAAVRGRWLGRVFAFLSSPLPPFGRGWRLEISVRVFRISLTLAAILYPTFGVMYHVTHPGAVDPMWIRFALSAISLALVAASYRSDWVRRNVVQLLLAFAYVDIVWICALAYANDLSRDYALGLYFVFVVAALLSCMTFDRHRPLVLFLTFGVVATTVVAFITEDPGVNPTLLVMCTASTAVALFVTIGAFLQSLVIMDRQHGAMIETQMLAKVGSWEYDEVRDHLYVSEGLLNLLGLPSTAVQPEPEDLIRLAHPEDREALRIAVTTDRRRRSLIIRFRKEGDFQRVLKVTVYTEYNPRTGDCRRFGICQDVTAEAEREAELVRARDQAEAARVEAEDLANLKSTLLANMSHEIRTPLTAILGFSDVLASEVDGELLDHVTLIRKSGKRLMETLNSVLDLAKIRSGNLMLNPVAIDANREAEKSVALLMPQAYMKGLALRLDTTDERAFVSADRGALDRVLANLLSNAIKFTDRGYVELSVDVCPEHVRFTVADSGVGIDPQCLPRIFEEFRQESEGITRKHEGSGLGLAITKQLVELMGGTIDVTSRPHEGSTFTVTLPRADKPVQHVLPATIDTVLLAS